MIIYAKLFTSIYQGTLRGNSHGLLVFTNLLAHCDKHGEADIHPRAIAEEVGLTVEQVRAALLELESPDDESRSPEEQGRRILRKDGHREWGWIVVNFLKYRAIRDEDDRREQNRLAQERWRNKNKPASAAVEANQPIQKQIQIQKQKQEIPHTPATTPTAAGRVCGLMRKSGLSDANPGHPTLLALLAAGTTDEEFQHATAEAVNRGKGFAYAIGMLTKQRDAAAALSLQTGPMPARETPWAREARERVHAMTGGLVSAKPPGTTKETLDGTELVNRVA